MLRLVCTICHECIVGRDTIEAHVAEHKSVGDAVQVWWAVPNGLVLRPVIAASANHARSTILREQDRLRPSDPAKTRCSTRRGLALIASSLPRRFHQNILREDRR
jgi:hypothetical protein